MERNELAMVLIIVGFTALLIVVGYLWLVSQLPVPPAPNNPSVNVIR